MRMWELIWVLLIKRKKIFGSLLPQCYIMLQIYIILNEAQNILKEN